MKVEADFDARLIDYSTTKSCSLVMAKASMPGFTHVGDWRLGEDEDKVSWPGKPKRQMHPSYKTLWEHELENP